MKRILLVYPKLGSGDAILKDIPLSLIYAATDSVKRGYDVVALDLRNEGGAWREALDSKITPDTILVGFSVMTGAPIKNAIEASRYVKEKYGVRVVWGGAHPTVEPDTTLASPWIDYLVRGFGSVPLAELADSISRGEERPEGIENVSYKDPDGKHVHNPPATKIEVIHFSDLPYQLVDINNPEYNRFGSKEKVFPIFTSVGCPHQCAFCMSPVVYRSIKKRWVGVPPGEVIEHIKWVVEKYAPDYISFYDDDAFVDQGRVKEILKGILDEGIDVKIGFRGARVDELYRIDDEFMELMEKVGVKHIQAGLESGSQRILKYLNKKTRVEQVIEVNRRFARFPTLRPWYNVFVGTPAETIEDLKETKRVLLQLAKENTNCLTGFPADYKPMPGSELYQKSIDAGFIPPRTLEEWSVYDTMDAKFEHPWYSKEYLRYVRMLQVCSYFIDDKIHKESRSDRPIFKVIRFLARLYKPIAMFRLNHDFTRFLFEYPLSRFVIWLLIRGEGK